MHSTQCWSTRLKGAAPVYRIGLAFSLKQETMFPKGFQTRYSFKYRRQVFFFLFLFFYPLCVCVCGVLHHSTALLAVLETLVPGQSVSFPFLSFVNKGEQVKSKMCSLFCFVFYKWKIVFQKKKQVNEFNSVLKKVKDKAGVSAWGLTQLAGQRASVSHSRYLQGCLTEILPRALLGHCNRSVPSLMFSTATSQNVCWEKGQLRPTHYTTTSLPTLVFSVPLTWCF